MNSLRHWLDQLWFPALSPARLATLRIAVGIFSLWYLADHYSMYVEMAATETFYFRPLGAVFWMQSPLSPFAFEALLVLTLIANLAFIAGLCHRFSGPLFGLLLLVVLSYRNSWTMIYHSDNPLVLHVLVLGFVASAEVWSADSWLRSRRALAPSLEPHWRFGWPVQLISALTASGYLLSAIAKLAGDLGWDWTSGESLRGQVAADAIRKALLGEQPPDLAFQLYPHLWIFGAIGLLSMLVELGAPAALLHRRLGYLWALNAFAMHWGIFFVMGITFRYQLTGLIFLSFFPLERLPALARRARALLPQSNPAAQPIEGAQ